MQAVKNFYHNNVMYKKYDNVSIKDLAEAKELKVKGLVADKVEKPKAKKDS